MKEVLAITKAMSDEGRLRVLMALGGGELCVCQLIELLELAPSTVSKHMAVLHQAGLVETRKDGRWIYYSLAEAGASTLVGGALAWLAAGLGDDAAVKDDAKRLKCVREMSRDELCGHYKK